MMKSLLENDFIAHYNQNPENPVSVSVIIKSTQEKLFELKDDNIIIYSNSGIAKYTNPKQITVNAINYENFISSLPPRVKN
jgi:hypothetical protein